MQFNGKGFKWYWKIIRIPVFVLVSWIALGFITATFSYSTYAAVFGGFAPLILEVGVFSFIGWMAVKDFKGSLRQSAIAGALAGAIAGLVSSITGILTLLAVPEIIEKAVEEAAASGIPQETVRQFIVLMGYFGIIIGPVIGAALGALIALIAGFVAKRMK